MTKEPSLQMENIVKAFLGVVADNHTDLIVEYGKAYGLLGENDTGKSMLMKILYGLHSQDDGEISLSGTRLRLDSPQDAIDARIGMVHRRFMLTPRLTVAENVVLGEHEPATPFHLNTDTGKWLPGIIRSNSFIQSLAGRFPLGLDVPEWHTQELAGQYSFDTDVGVRVWKLGANQQQYVEILKAPYHDVGPLILDEPTVVLTPIEIGLLSDSFERLTDGGVPTIFITHKLEEIEAVVDRVATLHDSENVGIASASDASRADLTEMVVGREVLFTVDGERVVPDEPVLRTRNVFVTDDHGIEALSNVDLTARYGEVVDIAGVSDNRQKELAEIIAELRIVSAGELTVDGRDLTNASSRTFTDNGTSFVPEDRNRYGSAGDPSVMHNTAMKDFHGDRLGNGTTLDYGELRVYAEAFVGAFDVRGIHDVTSAATGDLSGGNLQKLILAREISCDPDLLVANQPVRGVDVGAIESTREVILDQRVKRTGVVLLSEDLDEITDLSDRTLVVYGGEVVYKTTPEDANRERIGLEMTGGGDAAATVGVQVRELSGSP